MFHEKPDIRQSPKSPKILILGPQKTSLIHPKVDLLATYVFYAMVPFSSPHRALRES